MPTNENYRVFGRLPPLARSAVRRNVYAQPVADNNDYLCHFGVQGMRWGVRRYQNEDGTLTELGKKRYGEEGKRSAFGTTRDLNKISEESAIAKIRADNYDWYAYQDRARAATEKARGNIDKSNKKEASAQAYEKMAADYRKLSERGSAFIESIIKSANKSGKSVYSRSNWIEGTVPGRTWLEGLAKDPYYNTSVRNLFTVKDDKLGLRIHEQTLDPDAKKKVTTMYYYY